METAFLRHSQQRFKKSKTDESSFFHLNWMFWNKITLFCSKAQVEASFLFASFHLPGILKNICHDGQVPFSSPQIRLSLETTFSDRKTSQAKKQSLWERTWSCLKMSHNSAQRLRSWGTSAAIWVALSTQACKENIKASCSQQPQQMEIICAVYVSFYNLGKSSRWWHSYLYPDFKAIVVPTVPKGSFPLQQSQTKVAVNGWVIQTFSAAPSCHLSRWLSPRRGCPQQGRKALSPACALPAFQGLGTAFPGYAPPTAELRAKARTQMLLPVSNSILFLPDFSMVICSLVLLFSLLQNSAWV